MAKVGIVMGSDSDMPVMAKAADILDKLGIDYEMTIISAHREPDVFFEYAKSAEAKGFKVIIAGAGMAAHLPGMCAAIFPMPVIGIPMHTTSLGGRDSLYSIVQMPSGIPVATVAINGGQNAGILAAKNRGYNGEIIIGGVPLNEVNETNLMQRVVLVRHNSYLFKGTVEENLKMAKPDATKEEMEAVLQKVNLLGFLQTQDGLQTQLLEKASNLSGGQCQRLVIARALLRTDSAVYIFDEAASNIDVESEELIMNVIHELAKTKTVLLISHRLANVVKSDKIYFLKDGEIKESGKHDELMSQNGAYRHLYESQMALENYGKGGMA